MEVWIYYGEVGLKLFIGFALVLLMFHFSSSRKQFSQMTAIDLISNFILGGILSGFIYNTDISMYGFFIVLIIFFAIVAALNWFTNRTRLGRRILVGVPTIIIKDGHLDIDKLKQAKISMTDFMSLLRQKDIHSLTEVKLAQIEIGGELTVAKKNEADYALLLIDNGVINDDALEQLQKNEKWLRKELKEKGIKDISEVFCAQWYNKQFYIIKVKD
ncbi:MAG: DUF421 domain-containing protein [Lactobacillus sp.]|jgi:uncharacterized membrane protein YcaP (DUF421 family)|nr:DUF421 domain-containing protein [Lactobacillus sp.]